MKTKTKKTFRYRGNKQRGEVIALTSIVPRAVAVVVNAEAMLRNKSVSAVVSEIIIERYFTDASLAKRKEVIR